MTTAVSISSYPIFPVSRRFRFRNFRPSSTSSDVDREELQQKEEADHQAAG